MHSESICLIFFYALSATLSRRLGFFLGWTRFEIRRIGDDNSILACCRNFSSTSSIHPNVWRFFFLLRDLPPKWSDQGLRSSVRQATDVNALAAAPQPNAATFRAVAALVAAERRHASGLMRHACQPDARLTGIHSIFRRSRAAAFFWSLLHEL